MKSMYRDRAGGIASDLQGITEQLSALHTETKTIDLEFLQYLIEMAHTEARRLANVEDGGQ